jgi:hypothetical protein
MRNPSYLLILLALLLVAACGPKRPVVSTEGGEQLTTESGDPLRSYTARLAPQADAQ